MNYYHLAVVDYLTKVRKFQLITTKDADGAVMRNVVDYLTKVRKFQLITTLDNIEQLHASC